MQAAGGRGGCRREGWVQGEGVGAAGRGGCRGEGWVPATAGRVPSGRDPPFPSLSSGPAQLLGAPRPPPPGSGSLERGGEQSCRLLSPRRPGRLSLQPSPSPTWFAGPHWQAHSVLGGPGVLGERLEGHRGGALAGRQHRQPLPDLLLVAPGGGTRRLIASPLGVPPRPSPLRAQIYLRVWGRIFFPRRQSASALSMSSCTSSACGDGQAGSPGPTPPHPPPQPAPLLPAPPSPPTSSPRGAHLLPAPPHRLTSTSSQWKKWMSGLLCSESWHTSSSTDG